jgi:gas vesicle protein
MAHSHDSLHKTTKIAGIAFIGAFLGSIVALLFAPRDGKSTRSFLSTQARQAKQTASQNVAKKQTVTPVVDQASEELGATIRAAKSRLRSTAAKVKADTKQTSSEAKEGVKRTTKKTKDSTDEIRRNGEP